MVNLYFIKKHKWLFIFFLIIIIIVIAFFYINENKEHFNINVGDIIKYTTDINNNEEKNKIYLTCTIDDNEYYLSNMGNNNIYTNCNITNINKQICNIPFLIKAKNLIPNNCEEIKTKGELEKTNNLNCYDEINKKCNKEKCKDICINLESQMSIECNPSAGKILYENCEFYLEKNTNENKSYDFYLKGGQNILSWFDYVQTYETIKPQTQDNKTNAINDTEINIRHNFLPCLKDINYESEKNQIFKIFTKEIPTNDLQNKYFYIYFKILDRNYYLSYTEKIITYKDDKLNSETICDIDDKKNCNLINNSLCKFNFKFLNLIYIDNDNDIDKLTENSKILKFKIKTILEKNSKTTTNTPQNTNN